MHGIKSKIEIDPSPETVELFLRLMQAKARTDFWTYRQLVRPGFIKGWWQEHCSQRLQRFYVRYTKGMRPKMVMMAPPQHGKTFMVTDYISWVSGRNPDSKSIYTSYSDDLGMRTNADLQRVLTSPAYMAIFPKTRVNNIRGAGLPYKLNSELIEFIDQKGSFRNTTVLGQLTGFGLDQGIIDDPIKGRKEAHSKLIRDNTWGWLTDDFFTRFSDDACFLLVNTRWHLDDPAGRFLEKFGGEVEVVKFPAIATKDEEFRRKGEALFPEHKSLEFLLERKGLMTLGSWEALYQQNPMVIGGDDFPIDKFQMVHPPARKEIISTIRYWDKAATEDGGAFSCGVRMHKMKDKTFVVDDVRRGQWSASKREAIIKQTCQQDNAAYNCVTWIEQEPGSGGKESAESTIKNLAGFRAKLDRVTGDKEERAQPYAAQQQQGNVGLLVGAAWVPSFIDEHEEWPNGKFMDQVDAAGGAFNKLTLTSSYDRSLSWVGTVESWGTVRR